MLQSVSSSVREGILRSRYKYIFLVIVILYVGQLIYLSMRDKIDTEIMVIECVTGLKFIYLYIRNTLDGETNDSIRNSSSSNSLNDEEQKIENPMEGSANEPIADGSYR